MQARTRKSHLLSIVILFFIGFTFSVGFVGAFSFFGPSLVRVNEEGAVSVTAEYLPPEKGQEQAISFRLTFNTHTVDLEQYDIKKLSSLAIDRGLPSSAESWMPSGRGHHLKGILSFNDKHPEGRHKLFLRLSNIDSVEERIFTWQLPIE